MSRRRAVGWLLAWAVLGGAWGAGAHDPAAPAPPVEPRFEADAPGRSPFPSDVLAVPDPAQRTGLRVALPMPSCAVERSACDDVRLLNELDGFDLDPRLAVSFSGPVDPASVSARSLFLVRLAPGPPEAVAVERLVYDPGSHTLYARPAALLESETRYGLVVTRELRDASGRPIRVSAAFHRFLRRGDGGPAGRYRQGLVGLMAALARRGTRAEQVAVASVFTTGSVTTFLEQARDALDRRPPPPALMTAPEDGGRAYFPRRELRRLVFRKQVRVATDAPEAFEDLALPLGALPEDAVAGIGVGW